MSDTFEVQGETTKYVLRKPKVADWQEYYRRRKQLLQEYTSDVQGENFALTLVMVERCLIEPKIDVGEIPFSDFIAITDAVLKYSIPTPLQRKSSPMT